MPWKSYPLNNVLVIKEMFSFFELDLEKGFQFQGESHNFWECLYVQEGSLCISADERVYNLKKGELVFHKPLEFHKFYADNPKGAKIAVFSFTLDGELANFFRNKVFQLSDIQKTTIQSLLAYARTQLTAMEALGNTLHFCSYVYPLQSSKIYGQMLATYLYQLFLSLIDHGTASTISTSTEASVFRKAVDSMNANLDRQLSIADIAALCNTSTASLKRIFDKYAGIGVHKYFLQMKLKTAAELLSAGTSVREAAEKLGFSSQGYFSAAFKRETGTSPSEIKKFLP